MSLARYVAVGGSNDETVVDVPKTYIINQCECPSQCEIHTQGLMSSKYKEHGSQWRKMEDARCKMQLLRLSKKVLVVGYTGIDGCRCQQPIGRVCQRGTGPLVTLRSTTGCMCIQLVLVEYDVIVPIVL